jgi:hypothetical protein
MWAGPFATSFSRDGKDDENLIYVSILKQLTIPEAKLLKYMCEKSAKNVLANNIIGANAIAATGEEMRVITRIADYKRQETILYHLIRLKLSERRKSINPGGFQSAYFQDQPLAWLSLTSQALHLYLRCIGYSGTPAILVISLI